MNSDKNVRELFLKAVDQPDGAARAAFLDQACPNPEVRSNVEELLAANSSSGDFLEHPPRALALTIRADNPETWDDSLRSLSLEFLTPNEKDGCLGSLGPYEVVGVIGRGAFGVVLRAYDTKLNRIVAIKVMAPELASNPMAVRRFLREAQAAAAVRHDHVVTIYAIEETSSPPFIVMEYIEGQSLKQRVEEEGALSVTEILRIGMQIASGLAAAHSQGLVHRDIKPANILLENGIKRVQITDFGLARAVDDVGMTQTGIIAGTPQYMSPEQGLGNPIDARSDLFSLGSVIYTLCTGRPPFRADSAIATLRRVCDDEPRSIREINPDIPEWLEHIVDRLLQKEASNRYESAEEVTQVFERCLAHVQSNGESTVPDVVAQTTTPRDASRRGLGVADLGFVVLVVVQLLAGVGSLVAAAADVETIAFTGPVFGILVGIAIAYCSWAAQRSWSSFWFGCSSIFLTLALTGIIAIAGMFPPEIQSLVLVVLSVYLVGFVPWGIREILLVWQEWRSGHKGQRGPTFLNRISSVAPKRWADQVFAGLIGIQLLAIVGSAVASMIEVETIVFTGPVFGFCLGLIIAVTAWVTKQHWSCFLFGASSIVISIVVVLMINLGGLTPSSARFPVALALSLYAFAALPLGALALKEAWLRTGGSPTTNQLRRLHLALLMLQIVGIAGSAANVTLAFSSVMFTGMICGVVIGLPLTILSLYRRRSRASHIFSASTPVFALMLTFATLSVVISWNTGVEAMVAHIVVLYAVLAVPLGFCVLMQELGLDKQIGFGLLPQFDLRTAMLSMIPVALAFAGAKPCYAFGVEAYLAGTLFILSVLGVTCLIAYLFYRREDKPTPLPWFWLGFGALSLITLFMGFVAWYDGKSAYCNFHVATAEPIRIRVDHQRTGTSYTYDISTTDGFVGTQYGQVKLSIIGRDDLKLEPSSFVVPRRSNVDVKVVGADGTSKEAS